MTKRQGRRKAVILLNMGGPETLADVRPFLFNLFRDPEIIPVPWWMRWLRIPLAWMIAFFRSRGSRKGYAAIGGGSPQRRYAQGVADKLVYELQQQEPAIQWSTHICMRYFAPYAREVIERLRSARIEEILLLPLYPQYSTTTTRSSLGDFHKACRAARFAPAVQVVRHWHLNDAYLDPAALRLRQTWEAAARTGDPLVLYSAHGIPVDRVKAGDPYPDQVRETIIAVHERARLPGMPELAFQSRVGPVEWLRPSVADRIPELAAEHSGRPLVLYPVSFVSDHIETLEELDIQYTELALLHGFSAVYRVPVFNDDDDFVQGFARAVLDWHKDEVNHCWPAQCVVREARECVCVPK